MSYEFTDEQKMLREKVQKFVQNEYPKEIVRQWDKDDKLTSTVFDKMKDLGIMGLSVPHEYGGLGGNAIDYVIVIEQLAKACMALSFYYIMCVVYGGEMIQDCGSEKQKAFFLPKIAKGEIFFSYGITEPDAGSDAGTARTMAIPEGDQYIINGTKMFITGADFSDYCITLTRTDENLPKHKGLTIFIVDTRSKGYAANPLRKLGLKGSTACEVIFDGVLVPRENILGGPDGLNNAWGLLLKTLDLEHIEVSASAIGAAEAAFQDTLEYAKKREQFGQPIGKFQAIRHMLAEMAVELECARLLTYHAAWLKSQKLNCWKESCMAKLCATEVGKRIALKGMEIMGVSGYLMGYDMQRHVRDSLGGTIGGGTSQLQKNMIARALGL
jgi:alkylation response protein AidB-like acyl-CoA dehydrogenase